MRLAFGANSDELTDLPICHEKSALTANPPGKFFSPKTPGLHERPGFQSLAISSIVFRDSSARYFFENPIFIFGFADRDY